MKVNIVELQKRVRDGMISQKKHPQFDIWIFNYTYGLIYKECLEMYTHVKKHYETRKDQAIYLNKNFKYPGIVFALLDDKDNIDELVRKQFNPSKQQIFYDIKEI